METKVPSGTANATSAYYNAPSLPWSQNMSVCIGGDICGKYDTVTVDVPQNSYISYVRVYAHDNVGSGTRARLHIYLDGIELGNEDVKSAGGYIYFYIYAVGSRLVFQSTDPNRSYGEETVMQQIFISNQDYQV